MRIKRVLTQIMKRIFTQGTLPAMRNEFPHAIPLSWKQNALCAQSKIASRAFSRFRAAHFELLFFTPALPCVHIFCDSLATKIICHRPHNNASNTNIAEVGRLETSHETKLKWNSLSFLSYSRHFHSRPKGNKIS